MFSTFVHCRALFRTLYDAELCLVFLYIAELAVKVELLILSHDAYTCSYDMEGISAVLRTCRGCAIQINEISHYVLMVRHGKQLSYFIILLSVAC